MKLKYKVLGVNFNGKNLVTLKLKNLNIPPEIEEITSPNTMDLQSIMQTALTLQQKLLAESNPLYRDKKLSYLVVSIEEFKRMNVTVGDVVLLDCKKEEERKKAR